MIADRIEILSGMLPVNWLKPRFIVVNNDNVDKAEISSGKDPDILLLDRTS